MASIPRRRFLSLIGLLAGVGRRLVGQVPPAPEWRKFPFLDRWRPFKPRELVFPDIPHVPSFLHPNGKWVLLSNPQGAYDLWDWRTGKPLSPQEGAVHGDQPQGGCDHSSAWPGLISGNGKGIVEATGESGGDDYRKFRTIEVGGDASWEIEANHCITVEPRRFLVHALRPAHEGKGLTHSTLNGLSGVLTEHAVDIPAQVSYFGGDATLSSDGRWLFASSHVTSYGEDMGWWAVWQVPEGICRAYRPAFNGNHSFAAPSFSWDGARVYWRSQVWDWSGQAPKRPEPAALLSPFGVGADVVLAPGGTLQLERKGEGTLEVTEVATRKMVRRLVGHPPNAHLLAFAPERNLIVCAPPGGEAMIWNRTAPLRQDRVGISEQPILRPALRTLPSSGARSLAWSGNGRWIAVGSESGAANLFRTQDLRMPEGAPADEGPSTKPALITTGLEAALRSLSFGMGSLAAIDFSGTAAIWKLDQSEPILRWQAHADRGQSICLSKTGTWAVTGGLDGIALWSLPEAKRQARFGRDRFGVAALHLDPLEHAVAAAFLDGTIAVFDLPSGRERWSSAAAKEVATSVAIHPSGAWLVSASRQGQVIAWTTDRGISRAQAQGYANALSWSADGKRLALGSPSGVSVLDSDLMGMEGPEYYLHFGWNEDCT